jgi:hypothetical protein
MVGFSMSIEAEIEKLIDGRVEKAIEERMPSIIRAARIRQAESEFENYIDAQAVAKLLGYDLSSEENIRKAKKRVYNLAAHKHIPSIKLSERNIVFDPVKIREYLKSKEQAAA